MIFAKKGKKLLYEGLLIFLAILLMGFPVYSGEKEPHKSKIKIGVIGPMKFQVGQHQWWGAQLSSDEINSAGGVLVQGQRYDIELVKADSNEALSLIDAVNTMEKIMTVDKVKCVVGSYRSEAVLAMQEVMAKHRVPFLTACSASPQHCARLVKEYDKYKYYFKVGTPNSVFLAKAFFAQLDMTANKIREELGITKPKVALLIEKILAWDPVVTMAESMFPKLGLEIAGVWRPSPTGTDVTAELTAIKRSGAHIIFFLGVGSVGNVFSRQWGELQIPAAVTGNVTEAHIDTHWKATGGMCNYLTTYDYYAPVSITKKTIPFYNNFRRRFGESPTHMAATYDAIYVFKEAVERAGTLNADSLVEALEKTDSIGPSGRIKFFPKDHDKWPHDLVYGPNYVTNIAIQWVEGKQVVIWPNGKSPNPILGMGPGWEGLKYEGTMWVQLPPHMVEYWKKLK